MLRNTLAFALYALTITTTAAYRSSSQAPDCVTKCWSNSQYVSACLGDTRCLCDDAEFQNAVYQCLYSQCSTSKFGVALHHALGYCSGHQQQQKQPLLPSSTSQNPQASPAPTPAPQPALLRQDPLHKRAGGVAYAMLSNSVIRSVTRTRQSVSASAYMTYSTRRALATQIPDGQIQVPPVESVANQVADAQLGAATPLAVVLDHQILPRDL